MTNPKAFFRVFALLPLFMLAGKALAQNCDITPNTLAVLAKPNDTDPSLWSMDDGDRNLVDRFVGGLVDPADQNLIVAGERYYDEGQNIGLTLRKLDGRGRTIWEKIYNNKNFASVLKMIPVEKGFVLLANTGGRKVPSAVWVGFFDNSGALLKEKSIKPPKGAMTGFDMIPLNNANTFILAGQVSDGGEVPYTVLYRLDRHAGVVSRKAYKMGLESGLLSLSAAKGGFIYASGFILDKNTRKNAWLVKLNEDGSIVWQRQFARGKSAELTRVAAYGDGHVLAAGVSKPYPLKTPASRNMGAWIALFDQSTGNLTWERFYSEPDHDLSIKDFIIHDDTQISVLMDAEIAKDSPEDTRSFIRLAGLNARGSMLESSAYLYGRGASGFDLLVGSGNERVILGTALSPYTVLVPDLENPKKPPVEKNALAKQGLALAVPSINPYEDPCE